MLLWENECQSISKVAFSILCGYSQLYLFSEVGCYIGALSVVFKIMHRESV